MRYIASVLSMVNAIKLSCRLLVKSVCQRQKGQRGEIGKGERHRGGESKSRMRSDHIHIYSKKDESGSAQRGKARPESVWWLCFDKRFY